MQQPTAADFRARFARDFPFDAPIPSVPDLTKVQTADILNAFDDAATLINESLFSDQATYSTAYLYLAAHFLVMNLKQSAAGIAGVVPWLVSSKGVGPVSVSYSIPQSILDSPLYASLAQTPYGMRYLASIVGLLAGNIGVAAGGTLP